MFNRKSNLRKKKLNIKSKRKVRRLKRKSLKKRGGAGLFRGMSQDAIRRLADAVINFYINLTPEEKIDLCAALKNGDNSFKVELSRYKDTGNYKEIIQNKDPDQQGDDFNQQIAQIKQILNDWFCAAADAVAAADAAAADAPVDAAAYAAAYAEDNSHNFTTSPKIKKSKKSKKSQKKKKSKKSNGSTESTETYNSNGSTEPKERT